MAQQRTSSAPLAGYSGTSLCKKLGIRDGSRVKAVGAPEHYLELLEPLPPHVTVSARLRQDVDIWHLFVDKKVGLARQLRRAMTEIPRDGTIWVSWPKKSSGVVTDLTEGEVRRAALPLGLVDVKVCAVDAIWSGLKLVIRKELR